MVLPPSNPHHHHRPLLHLMLSTISSSQSHSAFPIITFRMRKPTSHRNQDLRKKSHLSHKAQTCSKLSTSSMSSIEMASVGKFRYQRLKPELGFDEVVLRSKNWFRFRRIPIRRRLRLKVPSLRRLWTTRARLVSAMRVSCAKVMKRLKDGQDHFGDLFAGNYLFLQVNPASFKYLEKKHNITGLSPNFYLPKVA